MRKIFSTSHEVKNGTYVKDIAIDPNDQAMVRSINDTGLVMGIKTIAEFVEDESIYKKVKELGIDYSQGYHFSKPELSI